MKALYRIENSIEIHKPISVVWDVVIQPQRYITYSDKFRFSDKKLRLGTIGEVTIGGPFYSVTYRFEVSEFKEGKSYTSEGKTSRSWEGRLRTSLDSLEPNITRVTRIKEYGLPFGKLAGLLNTLFFKKRYAKIEMEELQRIKQLAESKL